MGEECPNFSRRNNLRVERIETPEGAYPSVNGYSERALVEWEQRGMPSL